MKDKQVKALAEKYFDQIVSWRRNIHKDPELSFKEFRTTAYIKSVLNGMGISDIETPMDTGLVAKIQGKNPEKAVFALRADIDALPIEEKNDIPWCSQNKGVMHACGHDAHTASLLGAAAILLELRDQFDGTIKLIFQPGEEKLPGGASLMIKKGILNNPDVQGIIGQHVFPYLKAGQLGFRPGKYMAACDEIYIKVKGKGGHGALPDQLIDPVVVTAQIILSLQQIVSRKADPKSPTVLSFGRIIADGATNIIPDEVEIAGTLRTLDEDWRMKAHELIKNAAENLARSMGAECEVNSELGYPCLENDVELTERLKNYAVDYLGSENVVDLDIWMGGEDFSFYTHEVPAGFYRFGTGWNDDRKLNAVHTNNFDINEEALRTSAGFMAWSAICELAELAK